jgi:hypothetical protein
VSVTYIVGSITKGAEAKGDGYDRDNPIVLCKDSHSECAEVEELGVISVAPVSSRALVMIFIDRKKNANSKGCHVLAYPITELE